jgi:hypothetical protein
MRNTKKPQLYGPSSSCSSPYSRRGREEDLGYGDTRIPICQGPQEDVHRQYILVWVLPKSEPVMRITGNKYSSYNKLEKENREGTLKHQAR